MRFKTLYRAIRLHVSASCPNGHRVTLLAPMCMTKLPSFYLCATCGFIGEVGVGVVRKGRSQ
jgi:hypothetical protein